jgi:hypothetical protein
MVKKRKKDVDEVEVKKSTSKFISKWLEHHFPEIQKVYTDKKKVIEILGELKFDNEVDKRWYQNFMIGVKKRKDVELLTYLYDIFLSGEGLVVDSPEGETYETNWKKRYKNKFKDNNNYNKE